MGLSKVPKRTWSDSFGGRHNQGLTEMVNNNKFWQFRNFRSSSDNSRTVRSLALKFGQELHQSVRQRNAKAQTLGWLGGWRIVPRLISSAVVVVLLLLHLNVDYFGSRRSWRALQQWQDCSGVVLDDCVLGCNRRAWLDDATTVNLSEIQQGRILLLDWTTAARRTQRKLLLLFQEGMQVEEPIHCLLWKQELLPGSGRCNDSGYKRWVCCCLIGFYYAVIQQFTNRSKQSTLSSFLDPVGLSDCPGVPGTFGGPTGEIWGRKDQSEPEFWWKTCQKNWWLVLMTKYQ